MLMHAYMRTGQGAAAAKLLSPDLSQAQRACSSACKHAQACTRRPLAEAPPLPNTLA
eukprot:NODE_10027_length_453_cov_6.195545_g8924_i0.p1 GENE.NODE_10027_length_453_cov_6.195545_g8924_i0~~NODE_10027_length_453_cov_6.195545_g8924_i0.p1  ORF type:complete len:57 (-),score=2.75 NODE_10027_length_453_cov_6.195545_g8924_i0:95-265(-)